MNKRLLFLIAVSSCGLGLPALAQDQTITMTTTKSVGESMTLVVNSRHGGLTVDWGDGQPVDYGTKQDTITGTVAGSSVTVTASSDLYEFNCDDNGLSALTLTASYLQSLSCANNELTTLSLNGASALEELNCSGNSLTRLTVSSNASLKRLYASDNSIRTFTGVSSLEVLDLSDNNLTSLSVSSYSSLAYLDCSNNSLHSLTVRGAALGNLLCGGNALTTLSITGSSLSNLRDVVVANNSLTKLNLSYATAIQGIYCANNGLESVSLPSNLSSTRKLDAYDCNNNSLTFASLPPVAAAPSLFSYMEQAAVDLSSLLNDGAVYFLLTSDSEDDGVKRIDLSDYLLDSGGNTVATLNLYSVEEDGSLTSLTRNTDYSRSSSGISFLKEFDSVTVHFTGRSGIYSTDGFYLETVPFAVYSSIATGIDDVVVTPSSDDLFIDVNGTSVTLSASSARNVRIYTVSGQLVWQGTVTTSETTVPLSKGIYLVGNKKIAL